MVSKNMSSDHSEKLSFQFYSMLLSQSIFKASMMMKTLKHQWKAVWKALKLSKNNFSQMHLTLCEEPMEISFSDR